MSNLIVDQISPQNPLVPVNFTGPSVPTYNGIPLGTGGGGGGGSAGVGYIGPPITQQFTGDGSTTDFTLSGQPGTVSALDVSVGGFVLVGGVDFTLPSPSTLRFNVAPPTGETIFVKWGQRVAVGQTVGASDTFTGNGSATAFTLSSNPGSQANLRVSVNGFTLVPGVDFFWTAGTALNFTVAPVSGAQILVQYTLGLSLGGGQSISEVQTATSGQTAFTLANPYIPGTGNIAVFVGGIKARGNGVDYNETNGTQVTFLSGLDAGQEVEFLIGAPVSAASGVTATTYNDVLTGNGSTTSFTLSNDPKSLANLAVSIGGVTQIPGLDFTWPGGANLSFTTAPPNGEKILARYSSTPPAGWGEAGSVYYTGSGTGAITRSVASRLLETISVKDFGAKGDGVTDDTTAVRNAIAYAAIPGNPKEVHFPAGTYYITGSIDISFGVALIGTSVARRGMPGNWISGGYTGVTKTGTDILTDVGSGTTAATSSLFILHPQSKISGFNVWYKSQTTTDTSASIVQYAPTFYVGTTVDGNSDNCVIENCSALNCYEFIRIGNGSTSVGRTIVTDCFTNPFGPVGIKCRTISGDLPIFTRVFVENLFSTDSVNRPTISSYQRQNLVAFDLGYSQGVNLSDCIALACKSGVSVTSQTWAQIQNCLFDYCLKPIDASGGADRVFFDSCSFIKNIGSGHVIEVGGAVNHLSFTNCVFGDAYSGQKTGAFCYHTTGTIKFSACTFTTSYPAILNCGAGAIQVSASGIGYDRVTGANISIDGGPALVAGAQIALTNLNPTSPATTGWTYTTPANVTAITSGIRIQGVGNNTITYRPGDVSAGNSNSIFFGTGMYCLEFDYKVTNQAGSPKLEILVLNDSSVSVVDAFQLSQDVSTNDSGLPEGVNFHVSLILPWQGPAGDSTRLCFSLPSQTSSVHEITNMKISQISLPRGFTGLEWFHGKTKIPLGYFDLVTGNRIWSFPASPTAGTWSVRDKTIQLTPTVGQPKSWICTVAGTPGTWVSEGNL